MPTHWLSVAAELCAILTAIVALFAYVQYLCRRTRQKDALERYLRSEKAQAQAEDQGQRSFLNIMAATKMTEDEIVSAAFRSAHVRFVKVPDDKGLTKELLLVYGKQHPTGSD
jgi:hypothetical protein